MSRSIIHLEILNHRPNDPSSLIVLLTQSQPPHFVIPEITNNRLVIKYQDLMDVWSVESGMAVGGIRWFETLLRDRVVGQESAGGRVEG